MCTARWSDLRDLRDLPGLYSLNILNSIFRTHLMFWFFFLIRNTLNTILYFTGKWWKWRALRIWVISCLFLAFVKILPAAFELSLSESLFRKANKISTVVFSNQKESITVFPKWNLSGFSLLKENKDCSRINKAKFSIAIQLFSTNKY